MTDPKVTEEVTYSTIETSKKSTTTNKRILRNTWKGNAVQVNSYDSEGRLKSCETDKSSFQDHDTEYYRWTDHDQPPNIPPPDYDSQVEPFGANSLQTSTQMASNGSVLMLKSTEISSTPIVHWTGENCQQFTSEKSPHGQPVNDSYANSLQKSVRGAMNAHGGTNPDVPPYLYDSDHPLGHGDTVVSHTVQGGPASQEVEYKLKENLDGSKWSRTEETVWMSTNKRANPNLAITYGAQDGAMDMLKQRGGGVENGGMSVDERRQMRRNASRAMAATRGRDY